jgi:3',5'-cyclic-AMP phosphodiesterase
MLKIAHITDSHISEEGKNLKDIDTRQKFTDVLDEISSSDYDIIIHTGDLSYPDGNASVYKWTKEKLDNIEIPYYLTPGNHDNSSLMQEIFNLKDLPPRVILTGVIAAKGESFMFLDSSSERLTLKQSTWVSREINIQDDDLFLFMHHPPCHCDVKVMDQKYPYRTPDFFQRTIKETGRKLTMFTGHYHIEKTVKPKNTGITVYITPPTLGSLDPESEEYIISDLRPGWRDIQIDKQKLISTECRYLN